MVSVPFSGKGKLAEYRLVDGKRNAVSSINASEWKLKTPPAKEDFADDMEDGVYYRLVKVYKRGEKEDWEDVWTQGGYKKRKAGAGDLRTAINQAAEPLVAFAEGMTTISEAVGKMYHAMHGGVESLQDGHEGVTPEGTPMSELQALKEKLHEMNDLRNEVSGLMGYDPTHPQFPSLQFTGGAPWFMHPWILSYGQQFVSSVLNDAADAAQNFGYKFRQGMSGNPPKGRGQPQQATPPQPDPNLFESDDKELQEKMKRLQAQKPKEEEPLTAVAN